MKLDQLWEQFHLQYFIGTFLQYNYQTPNIPDYNVNVLYNNYQFTILVYRNLPFESFFCQPFSVLFVSRQACQQTIFMSMQFHHSTCHFKIQFLVFLLHLQYIFSQRLLKTILTFLEHFHMYNYLH